MESKIVCDAKNVIVDNNLLVIDDDVKININNLKPDMHCAPDKKYSCGTCLTVKSLCDLVIAYNTYMKKNNIKKEISLRSDLSNNQKEYKKYLLKQLTLAMRGICEDQLCWLKQEFIKELNGESKKEILENTYRPDGPTGKFKWLNTMNALDVLKQYEKEHEDFKYLGTVPVDFDDLEPDLRLSHVNYTELSKTKNKVGAVINLDHHYDKGSHWVGLYADLNTGDIMFYDSYGTKPVKRIRILMKAIADDCTKRGIKPNVQHNTNRHQFKNSECGVYSINFILRLLAGNTFEEIVSDGMSDDAVNKCRKVYFNNTKFTV